jgi:peptidyl-prolyl cis-trans isomerase B (cyclophilin B)
MKKFFFVIAAIFFATAIFSQTKTTVKPKTTTTKKTVPSKARFAEITTDYGTMVIRLYDSTPLHRDNFIKLVQDGFYDSLLFHRVIQNFMIQGGDPTSKNADSTIMLGSGGTEGDRIPAEFRNNYFHKKGVIAAARDDNPEKASSNCQFYIVQGQKYNDTMMNMMECNVRQNSPAFSYTKEQRKLYETIGGTPFLDQNYTVFGEVIKGLDVIDKIAAVQCNANDRPLQDVRMKIKMLN